MASDRQAHHRNVQLIKHADADWTANISKVLYSIRLPKKVTASTVE